MFKTNPPWLRFIVDDDEPGGDNATVATETHTDTASGDDSVKQDKPETDWKAHAKLWEKRALANQDAARKLKEYEDANKSELEKLREKCEQAERERATAVQDAARLRVAAKFGIPEELAQRFLTGDEEKMLADAELLAGKLALGASQDKPATAGVPESPLQGMGSKSTGGVDQRWIDRLLGKDKT